MTEVRQLSPLYQDRLSDLSPYANGVVYNPGRQAMGVLHASGNMVDRETVTIGSNVFIATVVNTDSTKVTSGAMVEEAVSLLTSDGALTGADAGDLVRVESEFMKVLEVLTATTRRVARGRCGTTIATHADATAIYVAVAPHASQIPFGMVATLTPAVWVPSLVAEINNALAGSYRATTKASTIFDPGALTGNEVIDGLARTNKVIAVAGPATLDAMLLYSAIPEACVLATTETLTNGAWTQGATMLGGAAPALLRTLTFTKVPTAAEVTHARLFFKVPFTPRHVSVVITVTSSGAPKAWTGNWLFAAGVLEINNAGGATDWAATDTVVVRVEE